MINYIPARLTRLEDQEPVIKIEEDENVQQHELREDEIFNDLYERGEGADHD